MRGKNKKRYLGGWFSKFWEPTGKSQKSVGYLLWGAGWMVIPVSAIGEIGEDRSLRCEMSVGRSYNRGPGRQFGL